MRLMLLAAIICVGVCLSYDAYLKPVRPEAGCYDGPATFVSMSEDRDEESSNTQWIVIFRVNGQRVAFNAREAWARHAVEGMRPGQAVRLVYDLPASVSAWGSELGPPTLRGVGKVAVARADAGRGLLVAVNAAASPAGR
jgi:hypothetical protein